MLSTGHAKVEACSGTSGTSPITLNPHVLLPLTTQQHDHEYSQKRDHSDAGDLTIFMIASVYCPLTGS